MFLLIPALFLAASPISAKTALGGAVTDIRKILKNGADVVKKESDTRKLLVRFVDFSQIAERSLGEAEWQKLQPAQKKAFSKLLQDLVEASYVSRINEADAAKIELGEETSEAADKAVVDGKAQAQGSEIHLKFHMLKLAGTWMIDDIEIDDVSIIRNYRSQFTKVISKSSFKDLEAKLQKKVKELRNGEG